MSAVPHWTTVEQMTFELDSIADIKSAELAMKTKNLTLGFDSTTQEGTHIAIIHLITETECDIIAINELPGGTAHDYIGKITLSLDNMADVYANVNHENYQYRQGAGPSCSSKDL